MREFFGETHRYRSSGRDNRGCSASAHSSAHWLTQAAPVNKLPIVFMGTPELACASLQALHAHPDFQIKAVVTQPDRPKGRQLKLQASPVKQFASRENLPVLQPERAREADFITQIRELRPELICVAAYGQILPRELLDVPKFGCLNVHTSLLPKYRGAAPIQWAVLNDDLETGVTIMKMDVGLDTGDILSQERTAIAPEDNAKTLHDRLAQIGADLLVKTIPDYISGKIGPRPQSADGVVYAPKIKKQDGQIDWSKPARSIWNQVRGLVPWPGAYSFLRAEPKPYLLKIFRASIAEQSGAPGEILEADRSGITVGCGMQALRIEELQLEGGVRLGAAEFLAGHKLRAGETLG
jgi:methionyl-tRNA formyltransferase